MILCTKKTIYVAFDETEFENEEACLNYESKCSQRAIHDYDIIFLDSTHHYILNPAASGANKAFYIGVPSAEAADALEQFLEIHEGVSDCPFEGSYNAYERDFYGENRIGWWRFNFSEMEWEKYAEEMELLKEEMEKLNEEYGF